MTRKQRYHRKYHRKHYLANKSKYIEQAKTQRAKLKAVVDDIKNVPCADCGKIYSSWVMQFDHVRGEKLADVARLITLGSLKKLLAEVAKCDIVCANCHAERTHKRLRA